MTHGATDSELLQLLQQAVAREVHVSVQYMLQHGVGAGRALAAAGQAPTEQSKFVASHALLWLPGATLKKTAITEMRHAEAIVERLILLGGEAPTERDAIIIGRTAQEALEADLEEERVAIELYTQIIDLAGKEHDEATRKLFQSILADERRHHRTFSMLLGKG